MGWICKNETCDRCNIEVSEPVEVMSYDEELGKVVNSAERCPRCGSRRIDTDKWDGSSFSSPGNKNVCNS